MKLMILGATVVLQGCTSQPPPSPSPGGVRVGKLISIPKEHVEAMLAHARSGYPNEICGVLLGPFPPSEYRVARVVAAENRETREPHVRYEIAPQDLLRIQQVGLASGLDVLGFYHSHPDNPARPSETDRRIAAGDRYSDGFIHVIVGLENGNAELTAWIFRGTQKAFEALPVETR